MAMVDGASRRLARTRPDGIQKNYCGEFSMNRSVPFLLSYVHLTHLTKWQNRMQSEHPPDEAAHVIQRGRVLGGLEPTRAFGDARYKWPAQLQPM